MFLSISRQEDATKGALPPPPTTLFPGIPTSKSPAIRPLIPSQSDLWWQEPAILSLLDFVKFRKAVDVPGTKYIQTNTWATTGLPLFVLKGFRDFGLHLCVGCEITAGIILNIHLWWALWAKLQHVTPEATHTFHWLHWGGCQWGESGVLGAWEGTCSVCRSSWSPPQPPSDHHCKTNP